MQRICNECQGEFESQAMVQFNDEWICAGCKPLYVQKIREGVEDVSEEESISPPPAITKPRSFWRALSVGILTQTLTGVPVALVAFNNNGPFNIWLYTAAAYWLVVIIICVRRSDGPTAADVFFMRWSFVPMLVLMLLMLRWITELK